MSTNKTKHGETGQASDVPQEVSERTPDPVKRGEKVLISELTKQLHGLSKARHVIQCNGINSSQPL